ncbi:ABC transporter ATP-binding protein [Aristaeella hokkaidonensis]|uniref:ABC transporter ATP-binding protein n=1 Tax=Aristaeella hokkaidonensis TaxID=3046382 RepID=A0AC61N6D1_9FIRM|nr:ABC transporter ATP-binding protein [Aristaeella hokkaidonensis]QUC66041.1 ABC transporter ATP-binding protein [Aristaeella hokkaidonensis]SNT93731.1 ATP-binding cassette, subfamily B [Aristaeella hokkaidonensis]
MFKKVSAYIGEYKKYTVWAAVLMSLGIVAHVIPYYFLYQIIAPLTRGEHIDLGYIMIRVAGVAVCEILFSFLYVQGLSFSHVSAYNTLKNLRVSLQGKLEKQPLGNIQGLGTGRIKKVFTDDIDQIELLLAHAIPEGIANIFIPALIVVLMFIVSWKLGLLSLVPLVVGMISMSMMMKAGMSKMNAYYESAARMNNTIVEYVNGMEVVKVFNKDGESYRKFGDVVRSYRDFTIAWYKVCWPWMAAYSSVLPCLALLILPVGALLVLSGSIALDKLVLVLCMSFAVGPSLLKAMNFAGKFPQLEYKIAELEKLMDHPPVKEGTAGFTGKNRDISFEDVHFSYEDTEVLHGVSLSLKQGTTTALVGESGSGKSTLAKLLVHYYDLDSGKIRIGGQDITEMSLEALNDQIAYVSQEQFLFNTTLYENILIGKPDATREQVLEAAHRAQCDEFLQRLPQGIETQAGDGGKQLSGGERQRISLARAILKDAPIIVLDEATAFMDPENEEKLNKAIDEIIRNKTVFVIAHRLSTVRNADRICVMKDGACIAADTHDKLLSGCAEYKKFWDASVSASAWKIKEA